MIKKITTFSPVFISLIQSTCLFLYVALVATVFWKGNDWFGPMNNYLGPVLVLSLLVVSALTCAIFALGIPFYLLWEKKQTQKAIKVVALTALWIFLYFLAILGFVLLNS